VPPPLLLPLPLSRHLPTYPCAGLVSWAALLDGACSSVDSATAQRDKGATKREIARATTAMVPITLLPLRAIVPKVSVWMNLACDTKTKGYRGVGVGKKSPTMESRLFRRPGHTPRRERSWIHLHAQQLPVNPSSGVLDLAYRVSQIEKSHRRLHRTGPRSEPPLCTANLRDQSRRGVEVRWQA
jgi:hypothetical protein